MNIPFFSCANKDLNSLSLFAKKIQSKLPAYNWCIASSEDKAALVFATGREWLIRQGCQAPDENASKRLFSQAYKYFSEVDETADIVDVYVFLDYILGVRKCGGNFTSLHKKAETSHSARL